MDPMGIFLSNIQCANPWGCARLEAEELHCTWPKRRCCWCRQALSLSLEMMVNYRDYMGLLWNSMDMYGWMWRRMGIPYFIPQSIAKWINPDKSGLVEESNMEKTWWLDGFREQFIPTLGCRLTQMYRQWDHLCMGKPVWIGNHPNQSGNTIDGYDSFIA